MLFSNHVSPFVLTIVLLVLVQVIKASSPGQTIELQTCNQQRALLLIQEQVGEAKSIDELSSRILILTRFGDLLWDTQRETARSTFIEAYDLAETLHRQKGEQLRKEGKLTIESEDPRFKVIQAISRHDSEWARRLTKRITDEAEDEVKDNETSLRTSQKTGEQLLTLATSILPVNQALAISLARRSFLYPATSALPTFLYKLAELDQAAADRLYSDALAAYAKAGVKDLFYLSAYPFALTRPLGAEAQAVFFFVPPRLTPSRQSAMLFLNTLLRRGTDLIASATERPELNSSTEFMQLYLGLRGLESIVPQYAPQYLEQLAALKGRASLFLTQEDAKNAVELWQRQQDELQNPFDTFLDKAERTQDERKKDFFIAKAILAASELDKIERIGPYAQQISDNDLRQQLLDWLYFKRAQALLGKHRLDEAAQYARKVEKLDERAYLFFEIASEVLKKETYDQVRARETLDAVISDTLKAPNTIEKARTQLGIAQVYAQFDSLRAFEVMRDAVKTINALVSPDLTSTAIFRRIEGRGFSIYATYQVRGFALENSFQSIATKDFEGSLYLARSLNDKVLRSLAILGLASQCLNNSKQPRSSKSGKTVWQQGSLSRDGNGVRYVEPSWCNSVPARTGHPTLPSTGAHLSRRLNLISGLTTSSS